MAIDAAKLSVMARVSTAYSQKLTWVARFRPCKTLPASTSDTKTNGMSNANAGRAVYHQGAPGGSSCRPTKIASMNCVNESPMKRSMKREYLNSISELRTVVAATTQSQIAAAFARVIPESLTFCALFCGGEVIAVRILAQQCP